MRLLSCYIEGYGKIKQKEYRFDENITAFCAENGAGKTTLASFIKAMFYGLKGYRKGSTEFCDREHFYPFDGSRFGGNLTFEADGYVYKIERFFGDKSETADVLQVYRNGEPFEGFGEEIGKIVFGVDKESFERTVFLESGDVEMKPTSGIHARLNGFLEGSASDDDLDRALEALDKTAKVYKKSRTGNDKVSAETAKLARLNEKIENARATKRALEEKYQRSAQLQAEIQGLTEQIIHAQKENERFTQLEHYHSLQEGRKRLEKGLLDIENRYPLGVPTAEEAVEISAFAAKEKELSATAAGATFTATEEERLSYLSSIFRDGFPTEERLLAVEREIDRLTALETARKISQKRLDEHSETLVKKFAHGAPTKEEWNKAEQTLQDYKETKNALERIPVWVQSSVAPQKASSKKYALFALLAVALFAVGGFLCFTQLVVGLALLAVGGVLLLADGFLYLNKKSSVGVAASVENPERRPLEEKLRALEDSLKAFLLPYGYHSGNGVSFDFASLQKDSAAYEGLRAEQEAAKTQLLQSEMESRAMDERLTAFFRGYGLSGDTYVKLLSDLRVRCKEFFDLKARKSAVEGRIKTLREEGEGYTLKLRGYERRYGLQKLEPKQIEEDVREYARLRAELAATNKQAEAYKREKGLDDSQAASKADLGELQRELQRLQSENSTLDIDIANGEADAEKLEDYESEKAACEGILKEYKRKHQLLSAAAQMLSVAEGRLRDKYVRPIKDEFLRYAALLERTLGEKVVMTKDFELHFERNGVERSEKHLSAGQRSVCALCFRLALIKNMYREQLPFLILDDPFVALDEGHLEKVSVLLKELSKDMQMIYFTCHESRKI